MLADGHCQNIDKSQINIPESITRQHTTYQVRIIQIDASELMGQNSCACKNEGGGFLSLVFLPLPVDSPAIPPLTIGPRIHVIIMSLPPQASRTPHHTNLIPSVPARPFASHFIHVRIPLPLLPFVLFFCSSHLWHLFSHINTYPLNSCMALQISAWQHNNPKCSLQ